MSKRLVEDVELAASDVVANSLMNRERGLCGVNSYERELGLDLVDELLSHAVADRPVAWLDLCCGEGRALREAAAELGRRGAARGTRLVGVDLVGSIVPVDHDGVESVVADLTDWEPDQAYDLITCVHGLHYVGDKLGLLAKVAGWLSERGRLLADLDLDSCRDERGRPLGSVLTRSLTELGFRVDRSARRVELVGRTEVTLPWAYLGADPDAGPNYTGQAAVDSWYRWTGAGSRPEADEG